ncbi:hypothetical protein CFI10_07270 [Marinobacterium iners]|uniref:hypothetical protein n=1 Tax=Marinobacterium iners TaxID=48076 RepID=UPI001A8FCDD5|nr:hypothetical protein [Marinobacterium iners]QSR34796.1 hypothetical protein CFI10_07270 [Marinobacterium iners]
MPKFITIGIEIPDELEYPNFNFGGEILSGRIVSASVHDVFKQLDATEEKLNQVVDIALETLSLHGMGKECEDAIQQIQSLTGSEPGEEDI